MARSRTPSDVVTKMLDQIAQMQKEKNISVISAAKKLGIQPPTKALLWRASRKKSQAKQHQPPIKPDQLVCIILTAKEIATVLGKMQK